MVAGDVELVFASRNERSFKQIEIETWNNYGEENALYLSTYKYVLNLSVDHTTWADVKLEPEKNSGLDGIRAHDLLLILRVYHGHTVSYSRK